MIRLIVYWFLFIKIIHVSSEGNSSLTFVIDDTRSMKYDISQVRKEVDSIMDIVLNEKLSQIKDIVLVTFNDPRAKLRVRTKSREKIKSSLRSIKVGNYDNHDCPEASLEGIRVGLENSFQNSYVYVFTDATAKHVETYEVIRRMCQYSQSQITFVLTGDCGEIHSEGYRVYNTIATTTGGQVYRVDKDEVDQVINTLKEMIKGKKSAYIVQTVPESDEYTEVPFTIDEKTEYAVITVSGKDVMLKLRGPYLRTKKLMWTKNAKVVKILDPVPGDYVVKVKGSENPNIVVYGRTDFVFTPRFSEFLPKYFDDATKQPVAGTENHLSIKVEDPDDEVLVEYAQILDMDGSVIKKMPLKYKDGDFYYTRDVFISPDTLFNVAVLGKIKKTGRSLKRVTSVPIQPQILTNVPDSKPEVSIKEGASIHSNYSGNLILTCDVKGKPRPSIIWRDSNGYEQMSEDYLRIVPNIFVNYLTLNNIKISQTYTCEAENMLGSEKASINVEVTEAFTVHSHIEGSIIVPYGKEKILTCDIRSIHPMVMAWYFSNTTGEIQIKSTDEYSVSDDNKHLTIKSMDTGKEGSYSCKAWLIDDENTKLKYSADVSTSGLSRPILDTTVTTVIVNEFDPATIVCRVLSAIPPATITWLYQDSSTMEYASVNLPNVKIKDANLSIDVSELGHSGNYKCIAKNSAGEAEHVTELVVKVEPIVDIEEPEKTLEFATMDSVTCNVIANPEPKIVWKDQLGNIIVNSTRQEKTDNFEYILDIIVGQEIGVHYFYCYAENDQGVNFATLKVEVKTPLLPGKNPEKPIELDYGKQATLFCNITSTFPLLIKWYKINPATNSKELVNDPEKFVLMAERSELRIHYADMDVIGQYVCEAELLYNNKIKAEYKMNVTVKDIGIPVIEMVPDVVEVKETEIAIIPCKLLKGIPPPAMIWEFMKNDSTAFEPTSGSGQYLRIADANLDHAGRYHCTARNTFGAAEKTTALIVYKSPAVKVVEGLKVNLKYGATLTLTCKVKANPEPTITWKDNTNNVANAKGSTTVVGFEYTSTLEIQNVKNPIKYSCIAKNNQGTGNAEVDVAVALSFEPSPPLPETTYGKYGKRVVIPCNAESEAPITRSWYLLDNSTGAKTPIVTNDKLTLSDDGRQLTIYSMDFNLEGQYSCEGVLDSDKNEKKESKTYLKTTGLVKPEIDKSVTTVKIPENDTAIINCMVKKGTPKPTITWQYKPTDSKEFISRDDTGEKLEIKHATIKDSAVYKCNASNVAGWDLHETQLTVQSRPIIIVENDTLLYTAVLGDVVLRIPCNAIGNPKPIITWKKDDVAIIADEKYSFEDGTLIINEPVEDDSDEYTCEAENDIGEDSKTFEARVTKYLEEFGPKHYIYLKVNETRKIECKLPYTDPSSIRWYLEESRYNDKTGPTIELSNVDVTMDGNYSCRMSDRNMAMTETYVVDIGYAPVLLNKVENVKWRGGNDELVDCESEAKPQATVEWWYNGEPINITDTRELSLIITNIGKYTCKISNLHGSTGKNVTVTASVCLVKRRKDIKPNSPLILTRPYDEEPLIWPELESSSDVVIIESEDKVTLSCPPTDERDNRFLQFPELNEIAVTCDHEDIFKIDDKSYHFTDFKCKETLKPVIVNTGKPCINNDTEWLLVGFNATEFVNVYKVCHDKINGMPLLTSYTMFKMNDMGPGINQDWYLAKDYEKGNEAYSCDSKTTSCCYAKQQFANVLDVNYGAAQISTYIDHVNSVPVWKHCSASKRVSWDDMEIAVRNQLDTDSTLSLWSGGSKFETNRSGGLVPRYLWKIVLFDESDVIVVVYVNHQNPNKDDILCKNVCQKKMISKLPCDDKYTYLCEFDDFLKGFNLTREMIDF